MSSRRLIYGVAAGLLLVTTAVAVIAAPASSGARAPASSSQIGAARFVLVVGGQDVAVFSDLVGLTSGFDTSELELNIAAGTPKLELPGKRTPPTVVLNRGWTRDVELWDWHDEALRLGSRAWKDAELAMFDYDGTPVARWTMENAWPSKFELGTLTTGGGQNIPVETMTIVCERLHRES